MKKAIDFILYGNVFIAVCAYVQVRLTQKLFGLSSEWLALFVGAATFFLYNLHKPITFLLKPQLVDNQRFLSTKRFSTPLSILTILAAIFCGWVFFKLDFSTQISLVSVGILSLAYVLPVYKKRRLRDVPYIKIFLIAFVWAFVVVFLPLTEWDVAQSMFREEQLFQKNATVFLVFLEKLSFVFAITIPFDIRDQVIDKQLGIKTIPLSIGEKRSKILAWIGLSLCFSISCVLLSKHFYDLKTLIVFGLTYTASAWLIYLSDSKHDDYFFYGWVDGLLLWQGVIYGLFCIF
jgi:4-hydroxybenzoate polyprenyltransferase